MSLHESRQLLKENELVPPDRYIIVGRGPAAVVNHATLAASGRLSRLPPVVHIGGPDTWSNYYPHRMGQWPVLLTLPGFSFHPAAAEETEFLWSSAFAQANADQASRMGIPFEAGRITAITGNDESGFELELTSGHRLSAAYVDICGGPGPPRMLQPAAGFDPALRHEYESASPGPNGFARVIAAERYLSAASVTPSRAKVCVFGGGPTAAWCAERALHEGNQVVWAGRDFTNAFVASGRNDALRSASGLREMRESARVLEIGQNRSGSVDLRFNEPIGTRSFDQVVVAIGQQCGAAEAGSWAKLLDAIIPSGGPLEAHELIDRRGALRGSEAGAENSGSSVRRRCRIR